MITIAPVSATVRRRVGIVQAPTTVWRPPIAAPIGKDRSWGCTQDERAQISCCVVRCNGAIGVPSLRNVRYVINRRAGRNGIDLLRNRSARCPWSLRIRRHEPHALETKVIDVADLDYLIGSVRGVLHRCPLD